MSGTVPPNPTGVVGAPAAVVMPNQPIMGTLVELSPSVWVVRSGGRPLIGLPLLLRMSFLISIRRHGSVSLVIPHTSSRLRVLIWTPCVTCFLNIIPAMMKLPAVLMLPRFVKRPRILL